MLLTLFVTTIVLSILCGGLFYLYRDADSKHKKLTSIYQERMNEFNEFKKRMLKFNSKSDAPNPLPKNHINTNPQIGDVADISLAYENLNIPIAITVPVYVTEISASGKLLKFSLHKEKLLDFDIFKDKTFLSTTALMLTSWIENNDPHIVWLNENIKQNITLSTSEKQDLELYLGHMFPEKAKDIKKMLKIYNV